MHTKTLRRLALLMCAAGFLSVYSAQAQQQKSEPVPATEIMEPVRTIRLITINNQNIFDLNDDRENGLLYRLANKLHVETRKHIIAQQLLFKPGDVFSSESILESERILRANSYLAEVTIETTTDGNYVDIIVITQDTWSTKPKVNYSQAGGSRKSELGIKEQNLFGSGVSAEVSYKSDIDRSSYIVGVQDNHVLGSWYSLGLRNESSSDGQKKEVELQKPFFSLNTRSSHGISYLEDDRQDAYYHLGNKYFEYAVKQRQYMIQQGWSAGLKNGSVFRHSVGLRYNELIYSEATQSYAIDAYRTATPTVNQFVLDNSLIPNHHKDAYPFYALDYLEDRYQEVMNIDKLRKTEDRYMGIRGGIELGYASTQLGSIDDTILVSAYLGKTFNITETASMSVDSAINIRDQKLEPTRFITTLLVKYYQEQNSFFKFYADVSLIKGHSLAPQNQLFLGGDSGLRGYPANYLNGDQIHKLTIEERYYSTAQPFRIFGVGVALFADVATIAGDMPLEQNYYGTYSDVGIGLRISNNRSSLGDIIHIDLASPLGDKSLGKGIQFNIQLKSTF